MTLARRNGERVLVKLSNLTGTPDVVNDRIRIGLGYDSHAIASGGPMRLGGIQVDCDSHFVGHSDADVLLHAVTDAILGAAGLEDIGQMFPNTDQENRDRDSAEMLGIAMNRVRSAGFRVLNIDCVVHSEIPKISTIRTQVRSRLADLLGIETDCVGLKGKTGEGSGDIGLGKLAEAQCVVLLTRE